MTSACNVFILAILASAAGVRLLPVPDAVVSPVLIPRSCQSGPQTAEEMLRAGWEDELGRPGHHPGGLRRSPCGLSPDSDAVDGRK